MKRKILGLVTVLVLGCVHFAGAQQPKKISRIGYLSPGDPAIEPFLPRAEPFRLALRELGYVEGQNIITEYRYAEEKVDRFPEVVAELVRLKVDVIVVAGGARLILAAQNATKTIPIVMMNAGVDPVELGLVKSIARPGGNITGLTNLAGELAAKRLELFKEAVPKVTRVAVLYDAAAPVTRLVKEELPVVGRKLGMHMGTWEIRDADSLERAIAALTKDRPDGVYVTSGRLMSTNQKRILEFALKSRLPSVYSERTPVDAGGLMSYGADLAASYRRVAYYVDKILKGVKPADLPVEQPTKFEFVINLKAAKQIGLTIPPNVLARADRVIR